MSRGSLRGRIVLGAVLWTIGLFAIAGALMTFAIVHHPNVARATHVAFGHTVPLIAGAILSLAVGLLLIRRGLSPVNQLRARLAEEIGRAHV